MQDEEKGVLTYLHVCTVIARFSQTMYLRRIRVTLHVKSDLTRQRGQI